MNDKISDHAAAMADMMLRAAEEQLVKAQTMMDQTKAMVEIMQTQVTAHTKANEDMNARFKQVGSIMLDAHRILNGDIPARGLGEQGTAALKPASVSDLARRGSFAGAGAYNLDKLPAGSSTFSPNPDAAKRDPAASYPARQAGGLPRAVAGNSEFDPRGRPGENRDDPGHATKQPNRD